MINAQDSEIVDLNSIVADILEHRVDIPKGAKVKTEYSFPTLEIDKRRIETVFFELLSNSINAIDHDEGLIKISYKLAVGAHRFKIEDNGHGMSEDSREKVFKLFFTNSKHRSGVGLTLARQIIESYSGSIMLQSRPEKGCIVEFSLAENFQEK